MGRARKQFHAGSVETTPWYTKDSKGRFKRPRKVSRRRGKVTKTHQGADSPGVGELARDPGSPRTGARLRVLNPSRGDYYPRMPRFNADNPSGLRRRVGSQLLEDGHKAARVPRRRQAGVVGGEVPPKGQES